MTYNFKHCEFLQLQGFLGLLVVMVVLCVGGVGVWGCEACGGIVRGATTLCEVCIKCQVIVRVQSSLPTHHESGCFRVSYHFRYQSRLLMSDL